MLALRTDVGVDLDAIRAMYTASVRSHEFSEDASVETPASDSSLYVNLCGRCLDAGDQGRSLLWCRSG